MESSVKLGRIWGIPIGVHTSWFLIFALVTWSLAAGYFPEEYPGLSGPEYWVIGLVTSLLFFGSVLLHELGHSYLALRNQIPVRGITLFIFGGVAQISQEPKSPGAEFRIAIAGPIVSLALAAFFGGLWVLDQGIAGLAAPSMWLARINLMLALFNMIPGFPLDGGRVLRAIVWKATGSYQRSTRFAGWAGQMVAFGFIGFGLLTMFGGNLFNGIWLAFIGWFLLNAAASSVAQADLQSTLKGVRVGEVMTGECEQVPAGFGIDRLVHERILPANQRCFFVAGQDRPVGFITLADIAALPRDQWQTKTVDQVMVPFDRLVRVSPETELLAALQEMDNANVAQIPVVKEGRVQGMLTRERILHYLRLRAELGLS